MINYIKRKRFAHLVDKAKKYTCVISYLTQGEILGVQSTSKYTRVSYCDITHNKIQHFNLWDKNDLKKFKLLVRTLKARYNSACNDVISQAKENRRNHAKDRNI